MVFLVLDTQIILIMFLCLLVLMEAQDQLVLEHLI